jgi:N-methylhydantoinase A
MRRAGADVGGTFTDIVVGGDDGLVAFDMDGTTAKASLIEGGDVSRSREYEVGAALSAAAARELYGVVAAEAVR